MVVKSGFDWDLQYLHLVLDIKIQEFLWKCYVLLKWIRFFPILGKKLANFPILLLSLQDLGACKICPRFGMHLQFHGYFSTSQVHLLFI